MSIRDTITDFYNGIESANQRLKSNKNLIEEKQTSIKNIISILEDDFNIANFQESNEFTTIKNLCYKQIRECGETISKWREEVNSYLNGKEFVNKFEESVLLIVFGDVKAGKSSLGNFISGYDFLQTPFKDLSTNPQIYIYDSADNGSQPIGHNELQTNHFKVGVTETTSTIQYFTLLDGLTWVDTPGIHSLTASNQDLANQYIKYADLILFISPSNNPCKQDESEEIQKLIKIDKPLLITISKSDIQELKIVNGIPKEVLSAKSSEDRRKQEEHISNQLGIIKAESLLSKNEFISISTRVALEGIKSDNWSQFESSNIPKFYNQISNVISENAIELKMKRPKDELNMVILDLIEGNDDRHIIGVTQLENNINSIIREIETVSESINNSKKTILYDCKAQLLSKVHDILYKANTNGSLSAKNFVMNEISSAMQKVVYATISKHISKFLSDFNDYSFKKYEIISNYKYEKKYETINYDIYEMKTITRDPKGLFEKIGSMIFGKTYSDTKTVKSTQSKQVDIGDNYNDIVNTIWHDVETQVSKIIDIEVTKIEEQYFNEITDILNNFLSKLRDLKTKLDQLKF
ncbi:MAG: dynamin family protein [Clostridium sp.]